MKTVCEAVRDKIEILLKEKKITLYRLEQNSGVPHGTMMGIMQVKNNSVSLAIIILIAGGFGMTVSEFLDDDLFLEDNLKI